jgi:hypothetical protein
MGSYFTTLYRVLSLLTADCECWTGICAVSSEWTRRCPAFDEWLKKRAETYSRSLAGSRSGVEPGSSSMWVSPVIAVLMPPVTDTDPYSTKTSVRLETCSSVLRDTWWLVTTELGAAANCSAASRLGNRCSAPSWITSNRFTSASF